MAAINECVNQTEDIHWRVKLTEQKHVQFSEFGLIKDVVLSQARSFPDECTDTQDEARFPVLLTEPTFKMDFTNHVNRIVVLCGDIDKDVEHLTLKYMYEHPELWTSGFPVGMYEKNINQQDETQWKDDDDTASGSSIVADDSIHVNKEVY